MSTKKAKLNPTAKSSQTKSIGLTTVEEQNQRFHTLTITDTAPTALVSSQPIKRSLYFLPKVAVNGGEVTEEMAEDVEQDDLYERFRLERSFVVYGIPIAYTTEIVTAIFEQLGAVESACWIVDSSLTNGRIDPLCRVCEVTMVDDEQYQSVLGSYTEASIEIDSFEINQQNAELTGVAKWDQEFLALRPNFVSLQQQVDLFMTNFDKRTSAESKAKKRPIVDEDGFTLVVGDDKNLDAAEKKHKKLQKEAKKRDEIKQKQRLDGQLAMYKIHEQQHTKKQQQEHHKQHYADKKIINQLKQQRSFNPF